MPDVVCRGEVLEDVLGLEGQVLGLGFQASSPRKLPCPQLEGSTIFRSLKILLENARNLAKICKDLFVFRNWRSPEQLFFLNL